MLDEKKKKNYIINQQIEIQSTFTEPPHISSLYNNHDKVITICQNNLELYFHCISYTK